MTRLLWVFRTIGASEFKPEAATKAATHTMDAANIWPKAELTPGGRPISSWRDDARTAVARHLPAQLQSLLRDLASNEQLLRCEAQKLLTSAACYDFSPVLGILLRQPGVQPDAKNKNGMTALHIAAGLGHANGCLELIKCGATVDSRSTDGVTPLMNACLQSAKPTIRTLLETGADPLAVSHSGLTPMKAALSGPSPECAGMILAYGAGRKRIQDQDLKRLPRSYAAARHGLTERLITLLDEGEPASLQRYDKDVAQEAMEAGHAETSAAAQAWLTKEIFRKVMRTRRPA